MSSKTTVRLVLFFSALPLILVLTLWDCWHYLPITLIVILASGFGAMEMAEMLRKKNFVINPHLPLLLGMFFPTLAYLENWGIVSSQLTLFCLALTMVLILTRQIFANTEQNLEPVLSKVTGILFTLFYPGFFLYYIIKIFAFSQGGLLVAVFCLASFGNDGWAWMFGNLWGKDSPKPFLVSPSKSLAGFIGGVVCTVFAFALAIIFFPGLLGPNPWLILGFAVLFGFVTIIGDLFESSLKRSAGVKDSGTIIPGRGGVLDSIDSLLFTAPLFYFFLLMSRGL